MTTWTWDNTAFIWRPFSSRNSDRQRTCSALLVHRYTSLIGPEVFESSRQTAFDQKGYSHWGQNSSVGGGQGGRWMLHQESSCKPSSSSQELLTVIEELLTLTSSQMRGSECKRRKLQSRSTETIKQSLSKCQIQSKHGGAWPGIQSRQASGNMRKHEHEWYQDNLAKN